MDLKLEQYKKGETFVRAIAAELVRAFVNAKFSGAERHVRRLAKVNAIESDAVRGVFDHARRVP
jgi:hypothetical protein